jgi:SAM-dependent methyltransferase
MTDNRQYWNDSHPDIETASLDYASRFSGTAGKYLLGEQTKCVERLISGFKAGSVLEVGGGHGQLIELYRKLGLKFTIHGSHQSCFNNLDDSVSDANTVVSSLRKLPFQSSSFDVVIAIRLITHADDWPKVLAEMCRVARHVVVFDYPTRRSLNGMMPFLFEMKKNIEGNTRTFRNFRKSEFQKILHSSGFQVGTIRNQFFIPMVVHRVLGGSVVSRFAEWIFSSVGATWAFGSPAVMKVVKQQIGDE